MVLEHKPEIKTVPSRNVLRTCRGNHNKRAGTFRHCLTLVLRPSAPCAGRADEKGVARLRATG
eukprot:9473001-Pyramimonas_sp.AAC.1